MPIIEAKKFRAEADGECGDADAAPAPDEIVAHLVHEDDDRQDEEERDDRADQQAFGAEDSGEDVAQIGTLSFWQGFVTGDGAMAANPWLDSSGARAAPNPHLRAIW
jgi:hypothetical protein